MNDGNRDRQDGQDVNGHGGSTFPILSIPRIPVSGRAFTMMELLVTLGILAIALASVLSIFARGSQFGLRAQERTEGGRVAQAVFDLIDRGFMDATTRRGRQDNGSIQNEPAGISSQDLATATEVDGMAFSAWKPAYVTRSHLDLVWRCQIEDHAVGGVTDTHLLAITVRFDSNGNSMFDELALTPERQQPDRLVGTYYAILADREVPP